MASFPPDGVRLRKRLQEENLSIPALVKRIQELAAFSNYDPDYNEICATQIYDMLSERHQFAEGTYRSVARGLGQDDYRSLTRRNSCVYHLDNAEEHNARIELIRLLHIGVLPTDRGCIYRYVTSGVATQSLPNSLLSLDVSHHGWRRVMESLCPAGVVEIRSGEYRFVELSTEASIRRTKMRLNILLECNRDLYDLETGGETQRKVVATHLRPIVARMRKAQSIEEYCDYDADAQLMLTGGDYSLYRHLLIDIQSFRFVMGRLNVMRRDSPELTFEGDFAMPYPEWSRRMMEDNTDRVEQLMKMYARDETTEVQTQAKIKEMVELTLANLRALDNALEARRGTRADTRRFSGVTWPAVAQAAPEPDRARPARPAHDGKLSRVRKRASRSAESP